MLILPMEAANRAPSHFSSSFSSQELYDWWLIKVETSVGGKQVGVAGFTSTAGKDARLFSSTAIVLRHDAVTLQTADGVTILLSGVINRHRTLLNGFSSEVCSQFLFGFPYNWEEFADVSLGKLTNEDAAFNISGFSESINGAADGQSSSTMSVDHLPAHVLRDILMSRIDDPEGMLRKSILSEIVHKYSNRGFNAREGSCLSQKSGTQVTASDLSFDETPSRKKKAKANQDLDENHLPDALCRKEDIQISNQKSGAGVEINSLSSGPLTRSRACLYEKTAVNQKQEEKRSRCYAESGQVDSKVNDNSASGPLTRSKARHKSGCAD